MCISHFENLQREETKDVKNTAVQSVVHKSVVSIKNHTSNLYSCFLFI